MEKLLEIAIIILSHGLTVFLGFFAASMTDYLQTIMGTPNGDLTLKKDIEDEGMILSFLGAFFARKFKDFEKAIPNTINPYKPFICEVCGGTWIAFFLGISMILTFDFYTWYYALFLPFATYYFQLKIWKNY
jgi:hypothetical protein